MSMKEETVDAVVARIQSIEAELKALQSTLDTEPLAANQRQYLARCFDLLHIELTAVRAYLAELR